MSTRSSSAARKYAGVGLDRTSRHASTLLWEGRNVFLGRWDTARKAAIARDRAVLHFGAEEALQVPAASRRLGPASPDELKRQAALQLARRKTSSGLFGVSPVGRRWDAHVTWKRRDVFAGQYATREEAAVAHDRVEKFLRPHSIRLNYPDREIVPTSPDAMRREATARKKQRQSSRYRGVAYEPHREVQNWAASITVNYVSIALGRWETERDAAVSYDRAALHHLGANAKLNVPDLSRRLGPADVETLLAEARGERKKRTTSRFVGVSWSKALGKWHAFLVHKGESHYLGSHDDEVRAALAYDDLARKLRGADTRTNFDAATGKFIGFRRDGTPAREPSLPAKKKPRGKGSPRTAKKSRFPGVYFDRRAGTYQAKIGDVYLGRYATAREAAIDRDRVILCTGRSLPLAFPDAARKLGPATVEQLARERMDQRKRKSDAGYIGVVPKRGGWAAQVFVRRKPVFVGRYAEPEQAALARDRAAVYLDPGTDRLNFPGRKLTPASPVDLRAEARLATKSRKSSRFTGVSFEPSCLDPWVAIIRPQSTCRHLGRWSTETDAAVAYDRAALFYFGTTAPLNLPAMAKRLGPATAEALRTEARTRRKRQRTTSKYVGVYWDTRRRKWLARVAKEGKHLSAGGFDTDVAAARARDALAVKLLADSAHLNFHPTTGEFVGGQRLRDLRMEDAT